jgi:hypothetical protein
MAIIIMGFKHDPISVLVVTVATPSPSYPKNPFSGFDILIIHILVF